MAESVIQEASAADAAVAVRGLRKTYGAVEAVADIDLTIARGEVFTLLGPNGAGKTTTVEIPRRLFVAAVADDRRGEREDFVGSETLTMHELAEQYLAACGLRRRVWNTPMPRRIEDSLDAGNTSTKALHGTTTWVEWLERSGSALLESFRQPFALGDRSHPAVASGHTPRPARSR
jgi:ABC-type uncharacterized transport system ATPase subunit